MRDVYTIGVDMVPQRRSGKGKKAPKPTDVRGEDPFVMALDADFPLPVHRAIYGDGGIAQGEENLDKELGDSKARNWRK